MKLVSFSVENYRSIINASDLPIRDNLTVLIGPNNEGKSNLLSALAVSLQTLQSLKYYPTHVMAKPGLRRNLRPSFRARENYSWEKDFPVSLQNNINGTSVFILQFQLDQSEISEFKSQTGSSLNGTLPIEIRIGQNAFEFKVRKHGRGGSNLSRKVGAIAQFISNRIDFQYIPSIRTASEAERVVNRIVERRLEALEEDATYVAAMKSIKKLQQPVLKEISANVTKTLREFLPQVKSVKLEISEEKRYVALRRSTEIIVDDGTPTALSKKGDGIISLAAISLMRQASQTSAANKNLILAIEEPESHLHPQAMHQLNEVVREISKKHQVIITTHNPAFIEKSDISANILVKNQKPRPTANIKEIRESLGVRVSDNLHNSEVVLIVEGKEDRTVLIHLLARHSNKIQTAFNDNRFCIDLMHGSGNLSYSIDQVNKSLCKWHCFLDHDAAGKKAYESACVDGLIKPKQVTFTSSSRIVSELEDWYREDVYSQYFIDNYGDVLESEYYKDWPAPRNLIQV